MTEGDEGQADLYPGVPRWVKVLAIIVAALLVLIVIVVAFGAGEHGPGRHEPASGASAPATDGAPRPLDGGGGAELASAARAFGSH